VCVWCFVCFLWAFEMGWDKRKIPRDTLSWRLGFVYMDERRMDGQKNDIKRRSFALSDDVTHTQNLPRSFPSKLSAPSAILNMSSSSFIGSIAGLLLNTTIVLGLFLTAVLTAKIAAVFYKRGALPLV